MVAEGAIDLALLPEVEPWDVVPLQAVVEAAGGRCSPLDCGAARIGALFSNAALHERGARGAHGVALTLRATATRAPARRGPRRARAARRRARRSSVGPASRWSSKIGSLARAGVGDAVRRARQADAGSPSVAEALDPACPGRRASRRTA